MDEYAYSERNIDDSDYQCREQEPNLKTNIIELNNFDAMSPHLKEQNIKPKLINQSQQSNENNNYHISLLNDFNSISGLITGLNNSHCNMRTENKKLFDSDHHQEAKCSDVMSDGSNYEISRIPSLKKNIYSVSTIATQAEMDKGTILAERKDYKYRNQEMSDVESQILSIEVDCYASIVDWCKLNNPSVANAFNGYITSNPNLNQQVKDSSKELASVTVNDYAAFKNCLNFQLQAASAMSKPICPNEADLDKSQDFQSQLNNRMIVRISSMSSSKSSIYQPRHEVEEPNKNKNLNILPTCSKGDKSKECDKNLLKLIHDAYQSALADSCSGNIKPEDVLKSFPNNLYMHLDSIPYIKSTQETRQNSKDLLENILKLNQNLNLKNNNKQNQLKQSSTLNTILDTNEPVNSRPFGLRLNKQELFHDPNKVYNQVELTSSSCSGTSSNDNETFKSSSNRNSDSDLSSTNSPCLEAAKKPQVLSSLSSLELQKELASYNLENLNPNMSKAEKMKKMLEEERAILEQVKIKADQFDNYSVQSPPVKAKYPNANKQDKNEINKFKTFIYAEEDECESLAEDYNYVTNDHLNEDDYNEEEDDEEEGNTSSNGSSAKNVRFADSVSYI